MTLAWGINIGATVILVAAIAGMVLVSVLANRSRTAELTALAAAWEHAVRATHQAHRLLLARTAQEAGNLDLTAAAAQQMGQPHNGMAFVDPADLPPAEADRVLRQQMAMED